MSILPILISRFNAIPIKFLKEYFVAIGNIILKFIWKEKETRRAGTILKKRNRIDQFADLKVYYKATIIKTMWY